MSAEIKQLLSETTSKITEVVRNTDWSNIFTLDNDTFQAALQLSIYQDNDKKAAERDEPSFNAFNLWLVKAVKEHPVSVEQFALASELASSFSRTNTQWVEGKGLVGELTLRVSDNPAVPQELFITKTGEIVVAERHSNITRPIEPNELLFYGEKIADFIKPENLERLLHLVAQAKNLPWHHYLPPTKS